MGCVTSKIIYIYDQRTEVIKYKTFNLERKIINNDDINKYYHIVLLPKISSRIKRLATLSFDIYTSINLIDLISIIKIVLNVNNDEEDVEIIFNTSNQVINKSNFDKITDKYPNCIDNEDNVIYVTYKLTPKKLNISNFYYTEECIICLNDYSKYYFLPCKHLCMCSGCIKYINKKTECYICNKSIESIGKISKLTT